MGEAAHRVAREVVRRQLLQRRDLRRDRRIVRVQQLADALAHRPQLASLIVGVNDTMRSTWDAERVREDLLTVASRLDGVGATLITVRFHDHGAAIGLPRWLSRPMGTRIDHVNAVYDEIYARWGGIQVDLGERPELHQRECWSIDRFHPSEIGHRAEGAPWMGRRARDLGPWVARRAWAEVRRVPVG